MIVLMNLIFKSQGKTFPSFSRKTKTWHLKEWTITTHIILQILSLQLFRKLHCNSVWPVSERSSGFLSIFLQYSATYLWPSKMLNVEKMKITHEKQPCLWKTMPQTQSSSWLTCWCTLLSPTSLCLSSLTTHRGDRENKPCPRMQQHHPTASFLKPPQAAAPKRSGTRIPVQPPDLGHNIFINMFLCLMQTTQPRSASPWGSSQLSSSSSEVLWFAHSWMFCFWNETYTTLTWRIILVFHTASTPSPNF